MNDNLQYDKEPIQVKRKEKNSMAMCSFLFLEYPLLILSIISIWFLIKIFNINYSLDLFYIVLKRRKII